MSRKIMILALTLALSMLAVAACGGQSAAPAEEPTAVPAEEPAAEEPAEATEEPAEEPEESEAAEEPAEESATAEENAEPDQAAAGMRHFVVAPEASTASYLVDEEFLGGSLDKLGIAAGAVDVVGSTQEVAGAFEIDVANGAIGANEFTVQINTLTTDQDRRDNWVQTKAPGFAQFPVATFVATSIEGAPADYADGEEVTFQLVGDLTVRDTAVPATFAVTATLDGDTITGVAIADLLLSDFGISPPSFANTLVVQDPFQVQMTLTAVEE